MVYIGADHHGVAHKAYLKAQLEQRGIAVTDMGATTDERTDYVDYAIAVAQAVAHSTTEDYGILLCGSGAGMSIAANKVAGIRAALVTSMQMAEKARSDDDANIVVLAADETSPEDALTFVDKFLKTRFDKEERHTARIQKIREFEESL